MNYTLKLKSNPNNPTFASVYNQQFADNFASKPKALLPFGLRVQQLFSSASIEIENAIMCSISIASPWKYNVPLVLFDININSDKSSTSPEFLLTKFHENKSNYPQHIDIYTDGSKIGDEVAAAAVSKHHSQQIRLPNKSSFFFCWITGYTPSIRIHSHIKTQ